MQDFRRVSETATFTDSLGDDLVPQRVFRRTKLQLLRFFVLFAFHCVQRRRRRGSTLNKNASPVLERL